MSIDDQNIPVQTRIQNMIYDFIKKHQSNVKIWTDNGKMIIQLSNVGVRDKNFAYIANVFKYTELEERIYLFDLPCACVYATNTIIRFCGEKDQIVSELVNEFRNNELVFPPDDIQPPESTSIIADESPAIVSDVEYENWFQGCRSSLMTKFIGNKAFKKEINILKDEWKKEEEYKQSMNM